MRNERKDPTDLLRQQAGAQEALLALQAKGSLRAFIAQAWPILEPGTACLPNWHIDLLCEYLEAVTAGQVTRLLINVPPRYMKSLTVSVFWPVWEWIQIPEQRWLFASYTEDLAIQHSLKRRAIVQSEWYQRRWGRIVRLATDQNVKEEFHNTRRGAMMAMSMMGSVTGRGGNRLIIDDPHNPKQAESDLQREAAITAFTRTMSTRLDDKHRGAIVVVMQRLHELDMAATCIDLGFTHVCLPAEAEHRTTIVFPRTGRTIVREPGEILWPAREGRIQLDAQKRVLGSTDYASQYQQRPVPAGGAIFQREWFKFYDPDELPSLDEYAQSWDMAFKDKPDNDFVVGLVGGCRGADVYLIDRVKGQWGFSETCRQFLQLTARYPEAVAKYVEDTANGSAIIDALKREIGGIIAVLPEGGKLARARSVQARVEAGNVRLPNPYRNGVLVPGREWVEDFIHACIMFPRGAHDDDVDAFTQLMVKWNTPPEDEWVIR